MKRLFIEDFGNSGSRTHLHGSKAKEEVGKAREILHQFLNANLSRSCLHQAQPNQITWQY